MKTSLITSAKSLLGRLAAPILALAVVTSVSANGNKHHLPGEVVVPAGNVLQLKTQGVGTQNYVWTQSATDPTQFSWVLKAPHAILLQGHHGLVGIHFGGPSWQANDGSKVVCVRANGVTVDPNAIPWLLLRAVSNTGDGIFTDTTFIQRLRTAGGLPPAAPGNYPGEEVLVPYVADYLFYCAK